MRQDARMECTAFDIMLILSILLSIFSISLSAFSLGVARQVGRANRLRLGVLKMQRRLEGR
jgi:hypothetical protein